MHKPISAAVGLLLIFFVCPSSAVDAPDIDKLAAEWFYPHAKNPLWAGKPSFYNVMLNTTDDAPTVLKHYAEKLHIDAKNMADPESLSGVLAGSTKDGESYMIAKSASLLSHGAEEIVLTHKSKTAMTNIVINRVPKRLQTRVTVTRVELGEK